MASINSTSINTNSTSSAPPSNQSEARAQQGPLHDTTDQPTTATVTVVFGVELHGGQGGKCAGSFCQQIEMMKAEVAKESDVTSQGGDNTNASKGSLTHQGLTDAQTMIYALGGTIVSADDEILTIIANPPIEDYFERLKDTKEIKTTASDTEDMDISNTLTDMSLEEGPYLTGMEAVFEDGTLILPKEEEDFYAAPKYPEVPIATPSSPTDDEMLNFFLEDSHAPRTAKRARTDGSFEDYIDIKELKPLKRNETSFTIVETTTFQHMVNRLHQIGNDASEVATRLYGAKSATNCSDFLKVKAEYLAGHNNERFMFGEFGL